MTTPRLRWAAALSGLGLVTAAVACLNPQPLPPAERNTATNEAMDAGYSSFVDGAATSTPADDASVADPVVDDAGTDADAGDAGDDGDSGEG